MRHYSGKLLLRVPEKLHQQLAKEAFETGQSINQLCLEALFARRALKDYDPWKTIKSIWKENQGADQEELEKEISKALKEVKRAR